MYRWVCVCVCVWKGGWMSVCMDGWVCGWVCVDGCVWIGRGWMGGYACGGCADELDMCG